MAVSKLPKNPTVRVTAILLAAFVAIAGAVKAYRELFPRETLAQSPTTVQVVTPPDSSTPPQPLVEAPVATPGYMALWECVPPALRGGVVDFNSTPLSQRQLDESLVFWSSNGTEWAPGCLTNLLGAGASPDAALPTAKLAYGSGPALHSAINQQRWENVRILLNAGANPNRETVYLKNGRGKTALSMAIDYNAPSEIRDAIRAKGGKSQYDNPAQ